MGEFINMNLEYDCFSLFSKNSNYVLRFKTIKGYLDENTIGTCVITDLGLKDDNFPMLNKNLYPVAVENVKIDNVKRLAMAAIESVDKR